jgi:formate dehydrogenase iron-sulfur subunit
MIGVLVDVTRCDGCNQCIDACVNSNQLGEEIHLPQQAPDGLSSRRYSAIVQSSEGRFVRKFCRHCLEPACVSVCPVGAMVKTEEGPVLYDPKKCMGCRYCMMACPFGIPRYEWDKAAPLVKKCDLCSERLENGQIPACVESCPNQVLVFGNREDLLLEAHHRIESNPERYIQHVYGESDFGGSSVIYVSDVPLDFLNVQGYTPHMSNQAFPELSWNWLEKVPPIAIGTAGLMTGLFWIIGRRMQAEESRLRKKQGTQHG